MTTRKITDTIDNIKQRLHTTSEDDDTIPLMQHAHSAPTPETTAKHVKQPSHGKFSLSSEDQFSLSEFLFSLRWMAAPILLIMLTYHYFVVPGLDKHMQLLMPQYVVFFFWILIWGYYSWATLIRRCYLSSYWHTLATQAWFCYQILTFFGPILPRFFTGEHPRPFGLFMLVCLGSNILVWCCQVFVEGIYFLYLAFRWATGPKAKARPHAEEASKRNQQVGDHRAIKDPHAIQVNRYKTVIILSLALAMTFVSLNPLQDLPMVVRIKQPLRGLQEKYTGITILQISDVHLGASTGRDFFERVVSQIRHLPDRIDVIAFTGDLVDGPIENYGSSIEPLEDLKGVAKYGSYYCTGNHEYISGTIFRWYEKIASHGVKVLHNQRDRIAGDAFDLVGIDDLTAIYYGDETNGHGANLTKALVDTSYAPLGEFGEVPIILMAHQPEHVHLAVAGNVDLHLSGHTHGGQFWPMHIPVWLGNPYLSGLHKHFNTWIYVSRGAGAWGPPMRLLAPHEITIFTLVPDKGQEPIITKTTGQASFDPAAVMQV